MKPALFFSFLFLLLYYLPPLPFLPSLRSLLRSLAWRTFRNRMKGGGGGGMRREWETEKERERERFSQKWSHVIQQDFVIASLLLSLIFLGMDLLLLLENHFFWVSPPPFLFVWFWLLWNCGHRCNVINYKCVGRRMGSGRRGGEGGKLLEWTIKWSN